MVKLTHISSRGEAHMVDISQKAETVREAIAKGKVIMKPGTLHQIKAASLKKGDVIAAARLAGIMAAKRTPDLIPLCHLIPIDGIAIDFDLSGDDCIEIITTVRSTGKTGVEMEALVATAVAALTIYDMAKSADKGMTIAQIYLESKKGGKSGTYRRRGS